jgi:hypothetical protein
MASANIGAKQCHSIQQAVEQLEQQQNGMNNKIKQISELISVLQVTKRRLNKKELDIFGANGNVGVLFVAYEDDSLVEQDLVHIRNCEFANDTVLFQRIGVQNANINKGDWSITSTKVSQCFIERKCNIRSNNLISRAICFQDCNVEGNGFICGEKTIFANGMSISPGLETGGRSCRAVAESTLEQLARLSLDQYREIVAMNQYQKFVDEYQKNCSFEYTIVSENATLLACPEILACYIGKHSKVMSGSRIRHSTLLDTVTVEQGSDVISSILQSQVHVSTQAIIKESFICEGGGVDVQGKLLGSILGPGSHLAEGEITSSLIGPMVGFHHQSMLIATFWPSGRGNVGYGANCGSNHTSRVSDQSMWPGEGVFFGLGACMKFPVNLSEAPYTVVATGVTYGPGRLSFPFSLVTSDGPTCRVAPGWGIISNAYAIERNSMKMKSRAPNGYSGEIFRPEIANLVWKSLEIIKRVLQGSPTKSVFHDDFAVGLNLGGGFATRDDLSKGCRAYEFFLELYALRGAVQFQIVRMPIQPSMTPSAIFREQDYASSGIDDESTSEYHRNHVISILFLLFPKDTNVANELAKREAEFAQHVYTSKARDHTRGSQVFPPGRYDEAINLQKDPVVANARKRSDAANSARQLKQSRM